MGSWHKFGKVSFLNKVYAETDEGESQPNRWITLRALRVLDWYKDELENFSR